MDASKISGEKKIGFKLMQLQKEKVKYKRYGYPTEVLTCL